MPLFKKDYAGSTGSISSAGSFKFEDCKMYKMDHKERGLALIFNHRTFEVDSKNLDVRFGAKIDRKLVERCFSKLGFEINIYRDKSSIEIKKILQEVSSQDHTDRDCLAVIVLTHGLDGILYAHDGPYKQEDLWMPFEARNCRSLVGKPKLFFIQSCRGENFDPGIKLIRESSRKVFQPMTHPIDEAIENLQIESITSENKNEDNEHQLVLGEDFLVAFATVPGYVAWNEYGRAWFIEKLCSQLASSTDHLLHVLTSVNAQVAFDMTNEYNLKQSPCMTSTLKKLLYLRIKDLK